MLCSRTALGYLSNISNHTYLLNDSVLPWYQEQNIPILRMLTDRGTEYKGKIEHHAFELFLSIEGIDHMVTKAYSALN